MARVGRTTVIAACSLEVSSPLNAAPRDGFVELSVQLTPLCSPRFKVGRPSDEALALQQHLSRVVVGNVLDLEQLCIEEAKAVWNLKIDVICLDHDGSCTDAALLAIVGALADLRVPQTVVTKGGSADGSSNSSSSSSSSSGSSRNTDGASGVLVETLPDEPASALVLGGIPLALSFGVFEGNLLVDPNAEEEALMDSLFTLVVGADELDNRSSSSSSSAGGEKGGDDLKLYSVYKPGGVPLGFDLMDHAMDKALELVRGDVELILKLAERTSDP